MSRAEQLAEGWIAGNLSDAEVREFLALLYQQEGPLPSLIRDWLEDPGFSIWADESREEALFQKIMEKGRTGEARNRRLIRLPLTWRIAVAMLLVISGIWLIWRSQNHELPPIAVKPAVNDLQPGGNRATLLLANGQTIFLDSVSNGTLAKQGAAQVVKLAGGRLDYHSKGQQPKELLYNTVTTPRGGQYQLTLADGTKVWLDAASSIRFPAEFVGKQRRVEITGQAYFEVSKDASKPFFVLISGGAGEVEVLGTSFNINAYSDEPLISTTLLDGAIRLQTGKSSIRLRPGQQGQFREGAIRLSDGVDVDAVMAWKNGNFRFVQADIHAVMRQVNRWYDVEIEYRAPVTAHFGGGISRNVPASRVLQLLELTGEVKFIIQGKKIIVMPEK